MFVKSDDVSGTDSPHVSVAPRPHLHLESPLHAPVQNTQRSVLRIYKQQEESEYNSRQELNLPMQTISPIFNFTR